MSTKDAINQRRPSPKAPAPSGRLLKRGQPIKDEKKRRERFVSLIRDAMIKAYGAACPDDPGLATEMSEVLFGEGIVCCNYTDEFSVAVLVLDRLRRAAGTACAYGVRDEVDEWLDGRRAELKKAKTELSDNARDDEGFDG